MKRKEPVFHRENRRKDKYKNDDYKSDKCKSSLMDCGAAKKWILHAGNILAAWVILTLADAAASEIAYDIVYVKWDSLILTTCLYCVLDILFVACSVGLYARYVLKMEPGELYMGISQKCVIRQNIRGKRPLVSLGGRSGVPYKNASRWDTLWYMAAILLPVFLICFCILFTDGSLYRENLLAADLVYAICWSVSGALRCGFTDGIVLCGMVLGFMKNKWNCMETILISGVLFAVFHFGFPTEGFITEKMILMTATLFVMGMAFAAVTCATGAIWASVTMYSAFSMLYGRTYILNIDTERDFNAIWNYTMKNENWLIAGFSGADGVRVGLTVLLAFLVVLLAALLQLRHSEAS